MADDKTLRRLDRRSFLRGSALFAGAFGLSATTAAAASIEPQQKPKPEEKPQEENKPADPFAEGEQKKDGKLYDKEGREYKVCPQCGYNMYKQGKMWVCENCGYSYVE
jgi:ribosomal protein S27AE